MSARLSKALESAARFVVAGDVVKDSNTGLIWTRANLGSKRLTWSDAKAACAAARVGGHDDWRLPTIQELLTLVDYGRTSPAIDPAFQCSSEWYWTSTPAASSPSGFAWIVSFNYGSSSWSYQSYEYRVRAVRAGQSLELGKRRAPRARSRSTRGKKTGKQK